MVQQELQPPQLAYGPEYYKHGCGPIPYERNSHWLNFFGGIADEIIRSLRPKRVFDGGCAWGFLVESLSDRGVEARGTDISQYAIGNVRPDIRPYCSQGSLVDPIQGGRYDLVTCIEVLEHMPEAEARQAIEQMTLVADAIFFSSTPDDFNEATHVNVHPIIYWLKLFRESGFCPDIIFDGSFLAPHAFLVRKGDPAPDEVLILFAETLRLRCQRAAFLTRHGRIEQLEEQAEVLKRQAQEAIRQSEVLIEKQTEMKASLEALSRERNQWIGAEAERIGLREELTLARFRLGRFEDLKKETDGLHEELTIARFRLEKLEDLEKETERLRAEASRYLTQIADTMKALSAEQERSSLIGADLEDVRRVVKRRDEDLRESAEMLEATRATLMTQRKEAARFKEEAEHNDALRLQSTEAATNLQYRLEESKAQASRAEGMVEEWMAHGADLSQNIQLLSRRYEAVKAEKDSLYSSPGWRLILRYRDWLQRSRQRHPWVYKRWEPFLLWAFRRAKVGGGLLPPSGVPAAPPSVSPAAAQPQSVPPRTVSPSVRSAEIDRPRPLAAPILAAPLAPPMSTLAPAEEYEMWIRENEPDGIQLEIQRRMSECFSYRPTISVLVPVYKVPVAVLRDTIDSVVAQTYGNWELCLTVPGEGHEDALGYLQDAARRDPRIRVKVLEANEGISGNSNQALTLATGEFLALLDHDDTLAPFALFEVAQLLNQDASVNFIYSDKDQISEDGKQRLLPLFKPRWSPELMLNANYLTHLCVMRTNQVREIGGWRTKTDGAQDWDLFLRIIQSFGNVRHIPKVLYHWRQISTSVASGGLQAKPYAAQGQVNCVKDHCHAIGLNESEVSHQDGTLRIVWPVRAAERVSIVYLSSAPHDGTLIRAAQLAQETEHGNFEILVPISGEASSSGLVKRIEVGPNASLRERIDSAVEHASGDTLVFVDEAVSPLTSDWLSELAGPLQLREVGIVGAKLLDPISRALRHCGIVFTADGRVEYIYSGLPEHVNEQAGAAGWYRNWSAVSGACFAIRRSDWDGIGGMSGDSLHPRLDVHLNLKLQAQTALRIVYNPFARMLQSAEAALENSSRAEDRNSIRAFFPEGDPFFSPNLDCRHGKVAYRLRLSAGVQGGQDYSTESQILVEIFDFVPAQVDRSTQLTAKSGNRRLESITWFLPEFNNAFYGGIHTILRFADKFWRTHQIRSTFCTLGHVSEHQVRKRVAAAFPELAAASSFFCVDGISKVNTLPATDAAVCSLWTTAYAALSFEKARRKFYFIQDDEALFYPAGSTSALVEATYRFGFHGICNTVSLLNSYIARGGEGEYFSPCIDTSVFHNRTRVHRLPHTLFCYGRPGHPRNSFELLGAALRILKQRMGDKLLAISAGAEWNPRDYRLDGVLHNLGVLSYKNTGALYRMCDAGVAIMMTRHPSYLPMELMACGSLVVTNRNPDTSWLLKDRENCLLSDLSSSSLADRLQEGLENQTLRAHITGNANTFVQTQYSDWDEQIAKVYRYMLSVC